MSDHEVFASGTGDGRHPDQAFCLCGCAWFHVPAAFERIVGDDGVTYTHMNGWSGPLKCMDCGEEYPFGWTGAITVAGEFFDPAVHNE